MALLTKQLLTDLGIQLSEQDYELLAEHFDTTLEQRVIDEIVEELEPEQAEQLAAMQQASDDQLVEWVKANVPKFNEIVEDEVNILLGELSDNNQAFSNNPEEQL